MKNNIPARESPRRTPRTLFFVASLAAGFSYRIIVGLLSPGLIQLGALVTLAAVFLLTTYTVRKNPSFSKYWTVAFAFFIFTVAGIVGDSSSYASLQQAFITNVLHETTSVNNPIAATPTGMVLGQIVGTLALVVPILVIVRASGSTWNSIYITMTKKTRWILVGVAGFLVFFLLAMFGLSSSFFPTNGTVSTSQFISFAPALTILVLLNGLREELWFRGLFLKKYAQFLAPLSVNFLQAIIFTSFHVAVSYSRSLIFFLIIALVQGLVLGYIMQKSDSILPGIIFHAGIDIPIFLVYLSYT